MLSRNTRRLLISQTVIIGDKAGSGKLKARSDRSRATGALNEVVKAVKAGAKLGELCVLGDKIVLE